MSKIMMTPKCKRCGRRYPVGNLPNGCPSMIGFQLDNKELINVCGNCMVEFGRMGDEERDNAIEELREKR